MSRAVYSYFASMQMPCSEIEKSLIMEAAEDFSDQIAIDVKNFILQLCIESMDQSPRKVIVFPEVNDLGELLIDEIIKIFPNLISFVVGPPKSKRIVVCSHAIVKNKVLEDLACTEPKKLPCEDEQESTKVQQLLPANDMAEEPSVSCTVADHSDLISAVDEESSLEKSSAPTLVGLSSCDDVTINENSKLLGSSFVDQIPTMAELPSSTPVPGVSLKSKSVVSEEKSSQSTELIVRHSSNSTPNKVTRPDEGTFRRVMTELYNFSSADRHRTENKVPVSSLNNRTRNHRNVVSSQQPQLLPSTTTSHTPRPSPATAPPTHVSPVSEKSSTSSSGDEEKAVPCLVQPEEDNYWKKLACAHLNEIYCILGSVEIVKPKWKQISYDMQISLKEHALGHILETYNMNEKIVTRDLTMMFSQFKTSGFNIKWVDSTKALIVFSSATKAAEALMIEHPVIKTRPVVIASRESKLRILQCSQYLLPYRDRPKTVATVARRMISNSLGIFPGANPEIAEKERNIIEQARAEKLLKGRSEYLRSKEKMDQGHLASPKSEECDDDVI